MSGFEPQTSTRISLTAIGSGFAVMLSIAALVVTIIEANTTRSAAKASVWPSVSVEVSYSSAGFSYETINRGVGPAKVRSIEITYDDAPYADYVTLVEAVLGPEDAFGYDRIRATNPDRRVISPGEEVNLFAVDWDPASRRLSEAFTDGLAIELCYCSIYDDCWKTRLGATEPVPVRACEG